ncbi:hypothetical protein M3Y99_00801900 [Aphelenchoides fujianensis]|nr:hypothetical protein M3Y99_00801900 [Aphelenchoides fujianensis]
MEKLRARAPIHAVLHQQSLVFIVLDGNANKCEESGLRRLKIRRTRTESPPPLNGFRSTDEALQKRFSNLTIDLWNLLQQYLATNSTSTSALESFLNARFSASKYKQPDGHLFAAEDQIRAVDEINDALIRFDEVAAKFRKAQGTLPALKALAFADGVPELLRMRVVKLSEIVPKLTTSLARDAEWKRSMAKRAPLATDDESVALVVAWRESALSFSGLLEKLHALVV